MVSIRIIFLFVFSVATATIIYNDQNRQRQYNPYSLYNRPYQTYPMYGDPYQSFPPTPLSPRFFILGTLGLALATAASSGSSGIFGNSSLFPTGGSGIFGNSSLFPIGGSGIFGNSSLFQIPRVQSCMTAFTGRAMGSCLNIATCFALKGFPAGICQFGLKTCCASPGNSRIPISSFIKTAHTTSPATFTIKRTSPQFCQVRIDFITFDIGKTNKNGYCTDGFWSVSGQTDTNVPILCGKNDGQHVYLRFGGFETPITMSVVSNNIMNDDWNIKATQIRCSDTRNIAPLGCLQYYPEATGQVKSFNFQEVSARPDQSDETVPTYQLSNLDYDVCLGSSLDSFSSITWSKGDDTTNYYFVLTENIALIPLNFIGTIEGAVFDPNCTTESHSFDYVEITNGQFTNASGNSDTRSLFCGLGFPTSVVSTESPFKLHVFTNSYEEKLEGSVGFSLSYSLS